MDLKCQLREGGKALGLPGLPEQVLEDLLTYQHEMLRWNSHRNLTAITDPEEAVEKHILDSLILLPILEEAGSLLDLGSGAGLPGIPLKIARPNLCLVSVDASAKKIAFQRHIVRTMALPDVQAIHKRIEELSVDQRLLRRFDLVVFRALGKIKDFVPPVLGCLAPGGRIVAMKGPEGKSEWEEAETSMAEIGIFCRRVVQVTLPRTGSRRLLLILEQS